MFKNVYCNEILFKMNYSLQCNFLLEFGTQLKFVNWNEHSILHFCYLFSVMKIDMLVSILVIGVICTFYTAIVSMTKIQKHFCPDSVLFITNISHNSALKLIHTEASPVTMWSKEKLWVWKLSVCGVTTAKR